MKDDVYFLEDGESNSASSTDDVDLICAGSGVAEGDNHDAGKMQEGIVEEKGFRDIAQL